MVTVCGDVFCQILERRVCVAHRDRHADRAEHFRVVVAVADGGIQIGQAYAAAHGTKCFTEAVAVVKDDVILAAYLDDFQFTSTDAGVTAVPNSDSDFAAGYAEGKVLMSKRANADYYSKMMAEKGGSTVALDANFDAIQNFAVGKTISERFAPRYYDAVTVGIDFTARELQKKLRAEGKPWELCKGFDGSAAIGEWVSLEKFRDVQAIHFHLDINGKTVQEGCTSDMLYRVDELIEYISQFFTLKTGDILFTGTPAGVGPVNIDDKLEGYLEDRKVLEFSCK